MIDYTIFSALIIILTSIIEVFILFYPINSAPEIIRYIIAIIIMIDILVLIGLLLNIRI